MKKFYWPKSTDKRPKREQGLEMIPLLEMEYSSYKRDKDKQKYRKMMESGLKLMGISLELYKEHIELENKKQYNQIQKFKSQSSKISVIETVYRGYRFRSRLEARWAVYFDSIGMSWEYEKEGYDFGDGLWYLPDFWLPQVKMWAEVKPEKLTEEELEKVIKLVLGTKSDCILLVGVPDSIAYGVVSEEEGFGGVVLTNHHGYLTEESRLYSCDDGEDCSMFPDVMLAVVKARQARFEYGE